MEKPDLQRTCSFVTFTGHDLPKELNRAADWLLDTQDLSVFVNLIIEKQTDAAEGIFYAVRVFYIQK